MVARALHGGVCGWGWLDWVGLNRVGPVARVLTSRTQ